MYSITSLLYLIKKEVIYSHLELQVEELHMILEDAFSTRVKVT